MYFFSVKLGGTWSNVLAVGDLIIDWSNINLITKCIGDYHFLCIKLWNIGMDCYTTDDSSYSSIFCLKWRVMFYIECQVLIVE
jgi:hypothetical protein